MSDEYRIVVTGSRDARDYTVVNRALARWWMKYGTRLRVAAGGQTGIDTLASLWAKAMGVPFKSYSIDHDIDGPWPGAGPRRNQRMYDAVMPDEVVAFPGGPGTASMKRIARRGGTRVTEIS